MDPLHCWIPTGIKTWSDALAAVDCSVPSTGKWEYWIPDPALFVGPQTEGKKQQYISKWLFVREAWLYIICDPSLGIGAVPPQWWRDYFSGSDSTTGKETRTALRKSQVTALFHRVFPERDLQSSAPSSLVWFGNTISPGAVPSHLCQQILWELYELGFRFELLQLDRHLCPNQARDLAASAAEEVLREELIGQIFPDDHSLRVNTLPQLHTGLSASSVRERAESLEAFRIVLCRWPSVPVDVRQAQCLNGQRPDLYIRSVEESMIKFYVQSFFEASGRAALVPHVFPML